MRTMDYAEHIPPLLVPTEKRPCPVCGGEIAYARAREAELPPQNGYRVHRPIGILYFHAGKPPCDKPLAEITNLCGRDND